MFLKKLWPILLLLVLEAILFKANYVPDTWFLGWDATVPELNLKLNLARILSAVWQEYRGVGVLDGMAHAANLVHLFYTFLLSIFLKANLVRYVFVFLMHFLGGVGAYFLTKRLLKIEDIRGKILALAASIFYLLNAGAIQMFYAPLEVFIIHFGFLPWLILTLTSFLESGKKKDLLLFFLVNLLSASQAHVPTVFIVSLGTLAAFALFSPKRALWALLVVFVANLFWAAPYAHSVFQGSGAIVNSKINLLSNPEIILRNRDFGDFKNTALLHGFPLNFQDWQGGTEYGYQLEPWRDYLAQPWVERLGLTFFGLAVLGATLALIKRKRYFVAVSLVFAFSFINLATEVPIARDLRELLVRSVPYYEEAFRFIFTKFIIVYALVISLLSTYALAVIFKNMKLKALLVLVAVALIAGQIYASRPVFNGQFIYPKLKVEVPEQYLEVFRFFDTRSEGRVAILPQPTFWNWDYLKWGYRGSGFIWQGIKNPVFHRSFDPWNQHNETFYAELSRAIYSKDVSHLVAVLNKYQIKYLLFDENIFIPGVFDETEFNDWLKSVFVSSGNIREAARFGPAAGGLTVYEVTGPGPVKFVSAPETFGRFDTDSTYSSVDTVFTSYGNYVNDSEGTTFPFVNFDKRVGVTVEDIGERILIKSRELQFQGTKDLVYPDLVWGEKEESPRVVINEEKKVQVSLPIDQKISADLGNPEQEAVFQNCDLKKIGEVKREIAAGKINHLAKNGGVACEFFNFPDLSHSAGYALRIKGENRAGRGLKIYLQNWKTGRMDLEELLPARNASASVAGGPSGAFDEYYFILPSSPITDHQPLITVSGYSLNLETRSFGRIASENTIEAIEFVPVPIEWLRQIRLTPTLQGQAFKGSTLQGEYSIQNNLKVKDVEKTGTWLYRVEVEGEGLLELGQGYEDGWIAFSIPNSKFQIPNYEHVKVNSWANGWLVPSSIEHPISSIYIFFWPQLLEYLGFGVLGLTTVTLGFKMIKA